MLAFALICTLLTHWPSTGPSSVRVYLNDEYVQHIDYEYDCFGNLSNSSNYYFDDTANEWYQVQSHTISPIQRLITRLRCPQYTFDYDYNQNGEIEKETLILNEDSTITRNYSYNGDGQQDRCETVYSLNQGTSVEENGSYTSYYTYEDGRLASQTTRYGDSIQYIEYVY